MSTVIRSFLGGTDDETARQRPDIVMLPESSIGTYSADSFDDENEINGVRSVVIVELKKAALKLRAKKFDRQKITRWKSEKLNLFKKQQKLHHMSSEHASMVQNGEQSEIVKIFKLYPWPTKQCYEKHMRGYSTSGKSSPKLLLAPLMMRMLQKHYENPFSWTWSEPDEEVETGRGGR